MKKSYTTTLGQTSAPGKGKSSPSPHKSTVAFLRQFARAYCPAPVPAMPGFVLN